MTSEITIIHNYSAPPERVFDAWLDERNVGRWLFATPAGRMNSVSIDPQIGGRFNITETRNGESISHTGEYLELRRPTLIRFTFLVEKYSSDPTPVSVEIRPAAVGTELALTHVLAPGWESAADKMRDGWRKILEGLETVLT